MPKFSKTFLVTAAALLGINFVVPSDPIVQGHDVEKAAQAFRVSTYQQYRQQRETYDKRRQAGDQVLEQWRNGQLTAHADSKVVQWFQQATESLDLNSITPLPASFTNHADTSQPIAGTAADPPAGHVTDELNDFAAEISTDDAAEIFVAAPAGDEELLLQGTDSAAEPAAEKKVTRVLRRAIIRGLPDGTEAVE